MKKLTFAISLVFMSLSAFAQTVCPNLSGTYNSGRLRIVQKGCDQIQFSSVNNYSGMGLDLLKRCEGQAHGPTNDFSVGRSGKWTLPTSSGEETCQIKWLPSKSGELNFLVDTLRKDPALSGCGYNDQFRGHNLVVVTLKPISDGSGSKTVIAVEKDLQDYEF